MSAPVPPGRTPSTDRTPYVIGLVVAVVVLLGSMAAVALLLFVQHNRTVTIQHSVQGWSRNWGDSGPRGMMPRGPSDRNGGTTSATTAEQANAAAEAWIAANRPAATLDQGVSTPMGYRFIVSEDGQAVGMLMVSDGGAQVRFRGYGPAVSPSPTPSAS
jgi:hypothetical protein